MSTLQSCAGCKQANTFAESIHEVPLHLVVCSNLSDLAIVDAELDRPSIVGGASVYPFVQNVLLGLRAEGLGAALTTLLAPAEAEVKRLLAIPDGVALAAYVLVGERADPWPHAARAKARRGVRIRRALRRAASRERALVERFRQFGFRFLDVVLVLAALPALLFVHRAFGGCAHGVVVGDLGVDLRDADARGAAHLAA